jgi:hypothetical protein
MIQVDERIGFWLAAALEDPGTCDEMKADIAAWLRHHEDKKTLRDLASKIDEVARSHSCYSQAHEIVRCFTGHLTAVGRVNELTQLHYGGKR